ncbi:MAG: VOC family protein [Gemmatimonadota bacterium]|nr:VOC family protein [Gemmatimonadota bacterium]
MTGTALGLRTVIYRVPDLDRAKAWYSEVFGVQPYFDQPYYVGFSIGGFELGLDPDMSEGSAGPGGSVAYWGVSNIDSALLAFARNGGAVRSEPREVGEGIKVGSVTDPFGNVLGLIENPHFKYGGT